MTRNKLYLTLNLFLPIIIFSSIAIRSSASCNRVCRGETKISVPYPFGFSQDCEIPLNCTNGRIRMGGFPVNVTQESLLVSLPEQCNRPIQDLLPFFGQNYAPTLKNNLLLQNCSKPPPAGCKLLEPLLESRFNLSGNCLYQTFCFTKAAAAETSSSRSSFMDFGDVNSSRCGLVFSSVEFDGGGGGNDKQSMISLKFETVELGWWMKGECNCSPKATCKQIPTPQGYPGFRCQCADGLRGDGFKLGNGCSKGSDVTLRRRLKFGLAIAGAGVGIIMGVVFLKYFLATRPGKSILPWNKKTETTIKFEIFLKNNGSILPKRYSFKEVKIMTNSFRNKLGEGGYGSVFKGKTNNENLVAVKVLSETKGNGEEFINEVASISRTSHVNVVSLLGYCFEGSKRALLYEFMPNGSLEKFIYDDRRSEAFTFLGWERLYRIAIGIARGLEYLHRGCNTRIVHFDIKPHNILLDKEFCPKISDFGLAKLCTRQESIVSMLGARGTAGYIAPEVISRNFGGVSHKSDVYSYGMMILEMVGGRKNIDVGVDHTSEIYFPSWIYKRLELNESLGLHGVVSEAQEENTKKMILVGLWCIQTNPLERPSISRVLEMLEGSLEALSIPPKPYLSSPPKVVNDLQSTMHH